MLQAPLNAEDPLSVRMPGAMKSMRSRNNAGFTLIELLIVVMIIGIIVAIAVPALVRARMAGNEASAIASLRTVNSAQLTYNTSCAHGYARSLAELASPPATGGQAFISPDLSISPTVKSGYTITYVGGTDLAGAAASCTTLGGIPQDSYFVRADPVSPGNSRSLFFGTNELQTVFRHTAAITAISTAGVPTPAAATPIK